MEEMKKMGKILFLCAGVFFTLPVYASPSADKPFGEAVKTDDVSYAFGIALGSQLKDMGLTFNYADVTKGLKDIIEGKAALSEEDAIALVQSAYYDAISQKSQENKGKEDQFLAENRTKDGVKVTESGLQYIVIDEGDGEQPAEFDTVQVNYEGRLIDGSIFDSSYERGEPSEFALDEVIEGWSEGLQLMKVGSKYKFFVPSSLAYGEDGAGSVIPPYATLIFEVELLAIVDPEDSDE